MSRIMLHPDVAVFASGGELRDEHLQGERIVEVLLCVHFDQVGEHLPPLGVQLGKPGTVLSWPGQRQ